MTAGAIQKDIFAANRASGDVALSVQSVAGRTRRLRVHEGGSLRVRLPNSSLSEQEAVIVNTAGGMTGGDRFQIDIALAEQARLVVTTAAAEKIYRSLGPDTVVDVTMKVAPGATLAWLPQETILFDRARLSRSIEADLTGDGALVICEAITFGRTAMGEEVNEGRFIDRWRIRRDGKLIFAETTRLEDEIAEIMAAPASANRGNAVATLLIAPAGDDIPAQIRTLDFSGEVGISAWNGIALARFCARDAAILRRDVVTALASLRAAPLPRLWLN